VLRRKERPDGPIASRLRRKGNRPREERPAGLKRKKERGRRGFEFFLNLFKLKNFEIELFSSFSRFLKHF
jgi:hypothetical protein